LVLRGSSFLGSADEVRMNMESPRQIELDPALQQHHRVMVELCRLRA